MILEEKLFEGYIEEPDFETIEKEILAIPGTTKIEWDYRPNDGVYKIPQNHFIVLVMTDNDFGDGLEYFKNRRTWKVAVLNKFKDLGWKLEDPMEDNDSYLYLVMERINPIKEGYELLDDTKVEVYSDYHKALNRAKELGLKEAEYGDDGQFSYCYWNQSGDRNDSEQVIAYYVFDNGKPRTLTSEERERIEGSKELTFDDELKEKLQEELSNSEIQNLFFKYMDTETNYTKDTDGYYDVEMYADYRDELSDKDIEKICDSDDRRQTFYELLWEAYSSAEWEYIKEIKEGFMAWVQKQRTDANNVEEIESWFDDEIYELINIHPDYNHFENQEVNTILVLDSGDANYDFSLNPNYYTNYGKDELDDKASIVWLVKQQGHTKDELVKAINEEDSDNAFIKSVVDECYNTSGSMNAVVFLGKCTIGDLIRYDKNDSVLVKKNAVCGLVDLWAGGGSILDIALEKDVNVPASNVWYFGIDGGNNGYGVDSIYGLVGSVWKDVFVIAPAQKKELGESALTEKQWKDKVPGDLAKAFHKAVQDEYNDSLEDVKDAVDAILDWIVEKYPDEEWEVESIRDAWELVDISDRFGDFLTDQDWDDDDYDDRTNEDYVNEEIISPMYDILDSRDIWMPLDFEIDECIKPNPFKESVERIEKDLEILGGGKLSNKKFTDDLRESVIEIKCAVNEIKQKYFSEEK